MAVRAQNPTDIRTTLTFENSKAFRQFQRVNVLRYRHDTAYAPYALCYPAHTGKIKDAPLVRSHDTVNDARIQHRPAPSMP
jgi:hypothetical protein